MSGTIAPRIRDADLSPGVRGLVRDARRDLSPYGWRVYVEQSGRHQSILFTNPLSPVSTGLVVDPARPLSALQDELSVHMRQELEFKQTKRALPPERKREVVGRIRWAATSYGWSRSVFRQVVDTLQALRLLSESESGWLRTVGPAVIRNDLKGELQKRVKLAERERASESRVSPKTSTRGSKQVRQLRAGSDAHDR